MGEIYQDGTGVGVDKRKATRLFLKACDDGYGCGCMNLGEMYEDGEGVAKNSAKAADLYGKGCSLKDEDSCKALKALKQ